MLAGCAGAPAVLPAEPLRDALLFGGALFALQVATPLVNALGMDAAHRGVQVDFGTARAAGSFAFALTSLGAGAVVAAAGAGVLPLLIVAVQVLLAVAALTFVFRRRVLAVGEPEPGAPAAQPEPAPLDAAGRRLFLVLLVGMTGAYVSHSMINTYMFQIATHHGGGAAHLGIGFTIAATIETIPMLFFRRLVARWSPAVLLRVAAVGLA